MSKKKNQVAPDSLLKRLIEILAGFDPSPSGDVREKVQLLVEANGLLMNLGASLLGPDAGSSARARILEYLKLNVGRPVTGEELMIVAGISEYARRVRELRVEGGWDIITGVTERPEGLGEEPELWVGEEQIKLRPDEYLLRSTTADADLAKRWEVANEIRKTDASVKDKILAYFRRNVGQRVTNEELSYLAKDRSEWARRVRELRTEEGWPILTQNTGAPELPVGVYVLQQDRQAPTHDRKIADPVRREVLKRDAYKCQNVLPKGEKCGWSHDVWNRADPRILELHHMQHHARGGGNDADNLITLCNVCHDDVHRREKRK